MLTGVHTYITVPSINHTYLLDQMQRLLFILSRDCVRRLFLLSLLDTAEVEESDPFADVEDKNELDENELL